MKHIQPSFSVLLVLFALAAVSSGFFLKNVGTKQCVKDTNSKKEATYFNLSKCTSQSTNFTLLVGRSDGYQRLASTWVESKDQKSKQKCAYGNTDSSTDSADLVWSCDCDGRQGCPYLQWSLKELGDSKYVIVHPKDERCLKAIKGSLRIETPCKESDPEQQWILQEKL